jgi:hypothetical protein
MAKPGRKKGVPSKFLGSPKLFLLKKWKYAGTLDKMAVDPSVSMTELCEWINSKGFLISLPLVSTYVKHKRQEALKNIQIESVINPIEVEGIENNGELDFLTSKGKVDTANIKRLPIAVSNSNSSAHYEFRVRSELEVLDLMIDKGMKTLMTVYEKYPLPVEYLLKAIEVKHKVTGGTHDGLTSYGIEELRDIEQRKFKVVLGVLLRFIPSEKLEEAKKAIETIEYEFYKSVGYLEEYEKLKGSHYEGGSVNET